MGFAILKLKVRSIGGAVTFSANSANYVALVSLVETKSENDYNSIAR